MDTSQFFNCMILAYSCELCETLLNRKTTVINGGFEMVDFDMDHLANFIEQ